MEALRSLSVIPKLPASLAPLWDLAYNCWFAWNAEIADLFTSIDHEGWLASHQNPVAFLNSLSRRTLEELARDELFAQRVKEARASLKQYLSKTTSPVDFPGASPADPAVAYFSLEYGLALCLPMYSGGLGILAGDHLKSASDLNLPLVGVGLCYREGYFRQYMTPDGWQQERYPDYDFEQLPMETVRRDDGQPLAITVSLAGETLTAHIWRVQVGRIRLFLLDTNIPDNPPELRALTARLYGGDLEMRLRQEILLGRRRGPAP